MNAHLPNNNTPQTTSPSLRTSHSQLDVVSANDRFEEFVGLLHSFMRALTLAGTDHFPLIERVERIEQATHRIEETLQHLRDAFAQNDATKESYSTAEAAKLLGKRPFTVREWCRLGRVRADKTHSGRGAEPEWRLSHDEVVRIKNHGLLPLPSRGRR